MMRRSYWIPGSYTYCISCQKFSSVFYINGLHRPSSMGKPLCGGEKRTAVWARIPRNEGVMMPLFLPYATTGLSLIAG